MFLQPPALATPQRLQTVHKSLSPIGRRLQTQVQIHYLTISIVAPAATVIQSNSKLLCSCYIRLVKVKANFASSQVLSRMPAFRLNTQKCAEILFPRKSDVRTWSFQFVLQLVVSGASI